jgi:hypothetical protein
MAPKRGGAVQPEYSSRRRKAEAPEPAYDRVRSGPISWLHSLATGASLPLSSQDARQRLKGVAERLPFRVNVQCEEKHGLFLGGGTRRVALSGVYIALPLAVSETPCTESLCGRVLPCAPTQCIALHRGLASCISANPWLAVFRPLFSCRGSGVRAMPLL